MQQEDRRHLGSVLCFSLHYSSAGDVWPSQLVRAGRCSSQHAGQWHWRYAGHPNSVQEPAFAPATKPQNPGQPAELQVCLGDRPWLAVDKVKPSSCGSAPEAHCHRGHAVSMLSRCRQLSGTAAAHHTVHRGHHLQLGLAVNRHDAVKQVVVQASLQPGAHCTVGLNVDRNGMQRPGQGPCSV